MTTYPLKTAFRTLLIAVLALIFALTVTGCDNGIHYDDAVAGVEGIVTEETTVLDMPSDSTITVRPGMKATILMSQEEVRAIGLARLADLVVLVTDNGDTVATGAMVNLGLFQPWHAELVRQKRHEEQAASIQNALSRQRQNSSRVD